LNLTAKKKEPQGKTTYLIPALPLRREILIKSAMKKDSITAGALMKSTGKQKRNRKNLTTDETQKPVFENHFSSDKIRLRREIMKSSGETNFVSQEMKPVSPEMKSITGEVKTISLMFFSVLHPKTSNSNIIIN
jgi:hypothetical protein